MSSRDSSAMANSCTLSGTPETRSSLNRRGMQFSVYNVFRMLSTHDDNDEQCAFLAEEDEKVQRRDQRFRVDGNKLNHGHRQGNDVAIFNLSPNTNGILCF